MKLTELLLFLKENPTVQIKSQVPETTNIVNDLVDLTKIDAENEFVKDLFTVWLKQEKDEMYVDNDVKDFHKEETPKRRKILPND